MELKMAFGRNGMGPCGKREKWSLGETGKLGEMASGHNEKWAKGQDRHWGGMGKGAKLERAKKEWAKQEQEGHDGLYRSTG